MDAESLAQQFHEAYERLAPQFGYKTREESAKPWEEVPKQNKNLMIAVCQELLTTFGAGQEQDQPQETPLQGLEGQFRVKDHIPPLDHTGYQINLEQEQGGPSSIELKTNEKKASDFFWMAYIRQQPLHIAITPARSALAEVLGLTEMEKPRGGKYHQGPCDCPLCLASMTARRFVIDRQEDVTGISGTGIILYGIEWFNGGPVDVYWLGTKTTGQYPSMEVVEKTHCYRNNAKVVYLD